MEIYLLANDILPSTQAWQDAVDALGFDVRFVDEQPLQTDEMRLRAECKGKPVLMELKKASLAMVRQTFPNVVFPDRVAYVHVLNWNKTLEGGLAAYQAAAAYVGFAEGLMIDTEEGKLNTPTRSIAIARDMFAQMPMLEAAMARMLVKISERAQKKLD